MAMIGAWGAYWRRGLFWGLLLSTSLPGIGVLWQRDIVRYGLLQLNGQWHMIREAKPLGACLQDSTYATWHDKIRLIMQVRAFAKDSLGLHTEHTYESMVRSDSSTTMWVVQACDPYALQWHSFSFPIIGNFPYKGFFSLSKANALEADLKAKGYDTNRWTAAGWSTLGYIDNPLQTRMLDRSTGRLVDLILHELVHNTLYVKNNAQLNENLASFLAFHGTVAFLRHSKPDQEQSQEQAAYQSHMADYKRYYRHFVGGAARLKTLYATMESMTDGRAKKRMKEAAITEILHNLDTVSFEDSRWKQAADSVNNTFFMSYLLYRSDQDMLDSTLSVHGGNVGALIHAYKQQYAKAIFGLF